MRFKKRTLYIPATPSMDMSKKHKQLEKEKTCVLTRKIEFDCGCVVLIRNPTTLFIGTNCSDTRKTCVARRTRLV